VNSNISAVSLSHGAGIGTGRSESDGFSAIEVVSIFGGTIRAYGAEAGIGSGFEGSEVRLVIFSETVNLFCTVSNPTKFSVNASWIVLSNTSLKIATTYDRVFGVPPLRQGSLNLSLVYGGESGPGFEPLGLLNSAFVQIGNITLPNSEFRRFCLSQTGAENCIDIQPMEVRGLIFSVPLSGVYSIQAMNENLTGFIERKGHLHEFHVFPNLFYIPEAHFIPGNVPTATSNEMQKEL
jgi:hypothetical protein